MRNTKSNLKKAAISAEGVKFTIDGFVDHCTNDLVVFQTACKGDVITDSDPWMPRQMNVDRERSKGRFLSLYSFDLMRNRTTSKIQYSSITILN